MKKLVSALLAFSMLFFYVPTLGAAEAGKILHEKITCIPEDGQAKLYAKVTPTTSFTSLKALFHSKAYRDDYFVELMRGPDDRFFTVLPWPDPKITKEVTYRIEGIKADGTISSTEQAIVPVLSNINCPVSLSKQEKKLAENLIVGHTTSYQPYAPPEGWYCKDIKYEITDKGDKRLAEDCRKLLALLPAGAAGAGAAGGVSTGVAVGVGLGAVAAVAAGGLIISNNNGGGGNPPVSPARP